MAEVSWIKIDTDIFNNKKIKQIMKMKDGYKVTLHWFMMLTLAGKINQDGKLLLTEKIPYSVEMLAIEFNLETEELSPSIGIFKDYSMMHEEVKTLCITGWWKYQNVDAMDKIKTQNKERQRRYREKKKEEKLNATSNATDNVTVTLDNAIDKDIDIDKEDIYSSVNIEEDDKSKKIKIKKVNYAEYVSMTEEEHNKLIADYGEIIIKNKITDLNLWKGSKGKRTKSDYMTILAWIRKDNIKPNQQTESQGGTWGGYKKLS